MITLNFYMINKQHIYLVINGIAGTADDKAQLLFNMYDVKRKGELTRDQFSKMLRWEIEGLGFLFNVHIQSKLL